MCQVSSGLVPEPDTAADGLVYVALQELATRIAHRNTGRLLGDSAGYDVMMRVAADENLHHLFYRDLTAAAIELDPSRLVQAIERQVVEFEMPGAGIPGFAAHAARDRPGRDLRPHDPPRPDPRAGRPAPLGCRAADRPRRRRRAGPRPADGAPGQERARRPPHGRTPPRPDVRLTTPFLTLPAPAQRDEPPENRRPAGGNPCGSRPPCCEHGRMTSAHRDGPPCPRRDRRRDGPGRSSGAGTDSSLTRPATSCAGPASGRGDLVVDLGAGHGAPDGGARRRRRPRRRRRAPPRAPRRAARAFRRHAGHGRAAPTSPSPPAPPAVPGRRQPAVGAGRDGPRRRCCGRPTSCAPTSCCRGGSSTAGPALAAHRRRRLAACRVVRPRRSDRSAVAVVRGR